MLVDKQLDINVNVSFTYLAYVWTNISLNVSSESERIRAVLYWCFEQKCTVSAMEIHLTATKSFNILC